MDIVDATEDEVEDRKIALCMITVVFFFVITYCAFCVLY